VPFKITRSYNSQSPYTGVFGAKWSSILDEKLVFNISGAVTTQVSQLREDGALRVFTNNGSGVYNPPPGYDMTLNVTTSRWLLRSPQGDFRVYDLSGNLL
jgi:hypothetical protein